MQLRRVAALVAGIALACGWTTAVLAAAQNKQPQNDIWKDEPKTLQRDLSKDQIERILKGIQQRAPEKAKALAELRQKDPNRFMNELRTQGRPEIDQMLLERVEARRQERNTKFLEWLKANYPVEEQTLAKLKEGDPQVYLVNFETIWDRYGYIFEAESSNPELGAVLKEDLALRKKSEELCNRHRRAKSEAEKQKIGAELQDVVARRYDLIVRRKEIAYEQLQKRLEDLQKQVGESKDEIAKFKDEQIKRENVRQRIEALVGNKTQFKWD
ncbi:MAG TPA: hypothetical protein PKZ07_02670 [Sedimentisphaerales bacterium]|nr:hypothetical protein [Sedimentisphaerales bacterium]